MPNQTEELEKPKILRALIVFVILQLLLIITVLILLAVMGYIGFENATTKIIMAACSQSYIILKYNSLLQYSMSIGFVLACVATLLSIILLGLVLKPIIGKREEN